MDAADWRDQLQPGFRQRQVNEIMSALKTHHPFADEDKLVEIEKVSQSFEHKAFAGATSKADYLQRMFLILLSIEDNLGKQSFYDFILLKDKLQRYISGPDGLEEIRRSAERLEDNIYTMATSRSDYLQKLYLNLKMLSVETRNQILAKYVASNPGSNSNGPSSTASIAISINHDHKLLLLPGKLCASTSRFVKHLLLKESECTEILIFDLQSFGTSTDLDSVGAETLWMQLIGELNWNLIFDKEDSTCCRTTNLLMHHLSGDEDEYLEIIKNCLSFEHKTYAEATSLVDYKKKISSMAISLERKSQNIKVNFIPSDLLISSIKLLDISLSVKPLNPSMVLDLKCGIYSNSDGESSNSKVGLMSLGLWLSTQRCRDLMDTVDWRTQLEPDDRKISIDGLMNKLLLHHHEGEEEEYLEILTSCLSFERKTFAGATSLKDYLEKTSSMMDSLERKYNWRPELEPVDREKTVAKIMDTFKIHSPVSGQENLDELRKIAETFENKVYTTAMNQSHYIGTISMKLMHWKLKAEMLHSRRASTSNPGRTSNG
ncbi:mediator of RNA polymerase II transcription subunit 15a-like isoform X1 [Senna tora]|uniref:Mediator of RNA polymerase II transcription subunit 15a-like isoform X1 n=1 Tax=Senna tora TaxID=362788 RepID=A0A835CHF1_9FABA|nr:mediator of RNA polymerase II transcription subunit 15a-like isoform X1 [Senna tora]